MNQLNLPYYFNMSRGTTIPTRLHVRPTKTQISLRMREVWSESSQWTLWVANDSKGHQTESEDTD